MTNDTISMEEFGSVRGRQAGPVRLWMESLPEMTPTRVPAQLGDLPPRTLQSTANNLRIAGFASYSVRTVDGVWYVCRWSGEETP